MIICKYKRSVSRDEKPFYNVDEQEFLTTTELEAYKIVQIWNNRGNICKDPLWRYDFISSRPAKTEELENEDAIVKTATDC